MLEKILVGRIDSYEINERYVIPFINFTLIKDIKSKLKNSPFFKKGELYAIDNDDHSKIYKYIDHIYEKDGVIIDSLLMQEINNNNNIQSFSLNKDDCELLDVNFEKNLQLFPTYIKWKKINQNQAIDEQTLINNFNVDDLSTYPQLDIIDGTLHSMVIKISGFECINDNVIKHENNYFTNYDIIHNLKITFKKTIGISCDLNSPYFKNGSKVTYSIITNLISRTNDPYSQCIDLDGCLFLKLYFSSQINNSDIYQGIPLNYLEGKKINDIFNINIFHQTPYKNQFLL